MLKLSEQQKQYSRVQGRLPNVLKVRHILLAETASTSSIYNSQTARFRARHIASLLQICNNLQQSTESPQKAEQHTHTFCTWTHQEQQHLVFIELWNHRVFSTQGVTKWVTSYIFLFLTILYFSLVMICRLCLFTDMKIKMIYAKNRSPKSSYSWISLFWSSYH